MKNTETPRVHHPYSPSKLQSLEACAKYKSHEFSDNAASRMGTLQHDMAENGSDNATVPDYKAIAVVECMKFVDERFAKYPGGKLVKEIYLPVDDEILRVAGPKVLVSVDEHDPEHVEEIQPDVLFQGTTAGYVDVGIVSADESTLEVIDFKFGKVAVESAANNLQGIAYLLGLRKLYPKATKGLVWFVMPHRDEITGAEFDLTGEAGALYLRIKTVVARAIEANKAEDDYSLANPTESGCLFCANLGKCPKVAALALKLGQKYAPLQIPESVSITVFSDTADAERGLKFSAVIKGWAEAYRTQLTAKTLRDPDFVPNGYKLVPTVKRKVVNARKLADVAKNFLPDELKSKVEELFDIGIGGLEDLISTAAPRGQKEKTVEAFGAQALAENAVEEGNPFAVLRQAK